MVISAFGLTSFWWALAISFVALLEGVMFSSLSMVVTSKVPTFGAFNYSFTLGITPMFFFSGVFFPVETCRRGCMAGLVLSPHSRRHAHPCYGYGRRLSRPAVGYSVDGSRVGSAGQRGVGPDEEEMDQVERALIARRAACRQGTRIQRNCG